MKFSRVCCVCSWVCVTRIVCVCVIIFLDSFSKLILLWILTPTVDCVLSFSAWCILNVLVAVLLFSGLFKRRCSVNAGEARPPFKLCCTGFMWGRRRGAILRRLARDCTHETPRTVENLLKRLQASQLDALATSIESRGAEPAPCVLLRAAESLRLGRGDTALPPHLLFCRLWRWHDLQSTQEIRPLPVVCKNASEEYLCCNPFHWTRLCKPGTCFIFTCL